MDAPVDNNLAAVPETVPAQTPAAAAEGEDDEDDEDDVPATKGGKRPAQDWQPHTFFPMNFGRTAGGSIAVANSFSTGKGNAFSHAIAYGSRKPSN